MGTSIAAGRSTAGSRSLRQVMCEHPLFFFFFMAYGFSWIAILPYVLGVWGVLPNVFTFTFVIQPFLGPTLAAFIMIGLTEGKAGVRRWLGRTLQVRAGWQWYLFILLGMPALLLLGLTVLPGALASFVGFPPHFLIAYLVNFVIIFFLGGPLGEELGWRGFALPRLQPRYGPLWGTLLLGVLWTGWHLPHFLTPAQRGGPGTDLAALFTTNLFIFFLLVMSLAIIFTWVFNHTHGSLFIAILLHASINTVSVVIPLFPAAIVTRTDLVVVIGVAAAALLIVILTRGQLGYQPSQEQALTPGAIMVPLAR